MARHESTKKPLGKLFEAGMAILLIGAALSIAPGFFTSPAPTEAIMSAMRIASWCAGALGIALLALHFIGRRASADAPPSKHDPEWTSQLPADLLRRHPRGFDHTETPPITRSMGHGRPVRRGPGPDRKA
jgi:hypothetical protein